MRDLALLMLMSYSGFKQHGYKITHYVRESYIDGVWNKDSVNHWLTEIQVPVEKK